MDQNAAYLGGGNLFISAYFKALITGTAKEALDVSKVASDLIGMLNRAAWVFAFGIAVGAAQSRLRSATPWWVELSMLVGVWLFTIFIPGFLVAQVFVLGSKNIREMEASTRRTVILNIYRLTSISLWAVFLGCATGISSVAQNVPARRIIQDAVGILIR